MEQKKELNAFIHKKKKIQNNNTKIVRKIFFIKRNYKYIYNERKEQVTTSISRM